MKKLKLLGEALTRLQQQRILGGDDYASLCGGDCTSPLGQGVCCTVSMTLDMSNENCCSAYVDCLAAGGILRRGENNCFG